MNRRSLIKKTAVGILGIFSLSSCQKENNNYHQKDELTELEILSLYKEYFGRERVEYSFKRNVFNNLSLDISVMNSNSLAKERMCYTKEHLSNSYLRKDVEIDIRSINRWLKS